MEASSPQAEHFILHVMHLSFILTLIHQTSMDSLSCPRPFDMWTGEDGDETTDIMISKQPIPPQESLEHLILPSLFVLVFFVVF